jgi:hypothetical protein
MAPVPSTSVASDSTSESASQAATFQAWGLLNVTRGDRTPRTRRTLRQEPVVDPLLEE